MHILLTNDDGIYAKGIAVLYQSLKRLGKVTVVAPDCEKSSVSHGITLLHPIWFKKVERYGLFKGYAVSGTPADCVKFAVSIILKKKPDIVVSGINLGGNDGCSVFYSGTVAGAREGALMGIPSVAISLNTFIDPVFDYAAKVGRKLVGTLMHHGLPKGTFLNVNVPNKKPGAIKGIRMTRQGLDPIHGQFRKHVDHSIRGHGICPWRGDSPRAVLARSQTTGKWPSEARSLDHLRQNYWMTGKVLKIKKDLSIDTYALEQGYVTITPIHCDSTDEKALEFLKGLRVKGLKG